MSLVMPCAVDAVRVDAGLERLIEAASSRIEQSLLHDLVVGMTSIASPTGQEGELARWLASAMTDAGLGGEVQMLDDQQANAIGTRRGSGGGASLMLYAPIDTLTVGTEEEDMPWIGEALRDDMRPQAVVDGPLVRGLGASNPKGHGACVLAALTAIGRAGIDLRGDLLAGFGAGGMPTDARRGTRLNNGHGAGCGVLLEEVVRPDLAVVAKPGWTVSWEEVGLAWVEVRVRGTHTYVGSRHRLPFQDAIVGAAHVIADLDEWFPTYTARHTSGTVAPQAIIGAIEGGWWRMAAVTPAVCRFLVDLRLAPDVSAQQALAEVAERLNDIARDRSIEIEHDLVRAIPGTRTPPDHPLVSAAVEAWERVAGREHEVITGNSGATDANILRSRGVPTVRVGMPKVEGITDFQLGMNTVDVDEMVRLTRLLVRLAINVASRPRHEVVG